MNVFNQSTGRIEMMPDSAASGAPASGGGFGVAGALSLVGKGLAAFGAYTAGKEQSRSLKAQAAAKLVEAEEVRKRGLWEQIRMNEESRRALSTQRQLFGQAGVTLEGAPADLMSRSRQEFVMDRMMHARNVAGNVASLQAEASELRKAAKAARRQGTIGAFSSFF